MDQAKSAPSDVETLRALLHDLAVITPVDFIRAGAVSCPYCEAYGAAGDSDFDSEERHAAACPWRRAREYFGLPPHGDPGNDGA